jgi:hypothetical protein
LDKLVGVDEHVKALKSSVPRERFWAAWALKGNYEPEVGVALVEALCAESDIAFFGPMASAVLPVWLPLFDRKIVALGRWAFTESQTAHIVRAVTPHKMHSIEQTIDEWLSSDSFSLRASAVRYLYHQGDDPEQFGVELFKLKRDVSSRFTGNASETPDSGFFQLMERIIEMDRFDYVSAKVDLYPDQE